MRKTLTALVLFLSLSLGGTALAGPMTAKELVRMIERKLARIDDMSWHYNLVLRPPDDEKTPPTVLTQTDYWYKKPGLARADSQHFYLKGRPVSRFVFRREDDVYKTYELRQDGTLNLSSHPAAEWETTGATPDYLLTKIKERIAQDFSSTVEYQPGAQIYVLKFDAPDLATFEINARTGIPYMFILLDVEKGVLVKIEWSQIRINTGLSDDLFQVPEAAGRGATKGAEEKS